MPNAARKKSKKSERMTSTEPDFDTQHTRQMSSTAARPGKWRGVQGRGKTRNPSESTTAMLALGGERSKVIVITRTEAPNGMNPQRTAKDGPGRVTCERQYGTGKTRVGKMDNQN